jgi:hypothetical protein
MMGEDLARRRAERSERADQLHRAQRDRRAQESATAQVLIEQFVVRAAEAGLPTEELFARPWSGRGRYRTGVLGWYLRNDGSVGVGRDGKYYVLVVPPVRFGRWRTFSLQPTPPPLVVGEGARDGESVALAVLLEWRLQQRPNP